MLEALLLAAVATAAPIAATTSGGDDERRLAALTARIGQRETLIRARLATLYRLSRGGLPRAVAAGGDRDLQAARLSLLLRVVRRDRFEIGELLRERDAVGGRIEEESRRAHPAPDPSASAIEPWRGRLAAPLSGSTPAATFGGLSFPSRGSLEVRAVGPGRVVFAAPFEGFERLVLVDHGGGDTSLYARLLDLAVSEGERVRAGQRLGRLPPGGALYFELRRGAELLPAARWLRR